MEIHFSQSFLVRPFKNSFCNNLFSGKYVTGNAKTGVLYQNKSDVDSSAL